MNLLLKMVLEWYLKFKSVSFCSNRNFSSPNYLQRIRQFALKRASNSTNENEGRLLIVGCTVSAMI